MVVFDFFPYLVDVNQPDALEKAIGKALKDKNYPAEHIADEIQKHYNWATSAKVLAQTIENNH
jgi:hypothetical protein